MTASEISVPRPVRRNLTALRAVEPPEPQALRVAQGPNPYSLSRAPVTLPLSRGLLGRRRQPIQESIV
jgi:hypothetical protein